MCKSSELGYISRTVKNVKKSVTVRGNFWFSSVFSRIFSYQSGSFFFIFLTLKFFNRIFFKRIFFWFFFVLQNLSVKKHPRAQVRFFGQNWKKKTKIFFAKILSVRSTNEHVANMGVLDEDTFLTKLRKTGRKIVIDFHSSCVIQYVLG